jgi:hypothetical protein
LAALVAELTRAAIRQRVMEFVFAGLFCGLMMASLVVAAVRALALPVDVGWAVVVSAGSAVVVAALAAWLTRPSDLRVAIIADLKLRLRQRLSTAWELAREGGDEDLVERLAARTFRSRLPPRSALVFPVRLNAWARLVPLAGALVVLVVSIDIERPMPIGATDVDALLAREGGRLREYGRRMEGRARGERLERSERAARRMQRLGSRMQSGALSRRQVLDRLGELSADIDKQRLEALSSGATTRVGPLRVRPMDSRSGASQGGLRSALQRLLDGELGSGDASGLLPGSGSGASQLSREALEEALKSFEEGDRKALEKMLDELAERERARSDAEELRRARKAVDSARENIGESDMGPGRLEEGMQDGPGGGSARPGEGGPGLEGERNGDEFAGGASTPGRGRGSTNPADRRYRSDGGNSDSRPRRGTLLQPEGQLREGKVWTSEARVLPHAGEVTVERTQVERTFRAQIEEVMAKEDYPLHRKEYLRRYFLALSEGVPPQSQDAQVAPDSTRRAPEPADSPPATEGNSL